MVCKNCGAEYEHFLSKCPYCDAENVEVSYRKQQDYVNSYKKKANFFAKLPDRLVHQTGSVMGRTALIIGVVFLLVLIIGFIGAYLYSATAVGRMDRQIEKLEEYYVAQDYEGLREYYYSLDSTYGGSYEKYDRVIDIYRRLQNRLNDFENWQDPLYLEHYTVEDIEREFASLVALVHDIRELEAEGYLYGEGEAIESFKAELELAMEKSVPISEEELEAALERYEEDWNSSFLAEAQVLLERLRGDTEDEMQ